MCVTWCYRRRLLFWNHEDCPASLCEFAGQDTGRCADCRHRRDDGYCALTNHSLPETGGCCHWNVTVTEGPQPVGSETLDLLWPTNASEAITLILDRLDAPYTLDEGGGVWVDPDALGLPEVYGVGTDELDEPTIPILQNFNFEW